MKEILKDDMPLHYELGPNKKIAQLDIAIKKPNRILQAATRPTTNIVQR